MTKEESAFLSAGNIDNSVKSQMFGKPCFKVNGKAFVCFFLSDMVFKLTGDKHEEALSLEGAKLFDPSAKGRPMKEWVQVPFKHSEKWTDLAKAAKEYVEGKQK